MWVWCVVVVVCSDGEVVVWEWCVVVAVSWVVARMCCGYGV